MGSGGPPSRRPPGGGGPPSMGMSSGSSSSSNNMGMGGLAGVNERTRQMASTRLPPSLQAKLAAVSRFSSC